MKWNKVALVVLTRNMDDTTVLEDKEYYIKRYQIPSNLVVTVNQVESQFKWAQGEVYVGRELATMKGVLAGQLNKRSKIIVVAHGSPPPKVMCARLDAILVSRLLRMLGVTEVGLISFKSCFTGLGSYLEEFTVSCTHENIRFGWCLAYINATGLTWTDVATGESKYFRRQLVGAHDLYTYLLSGGYGKLPDSYRVRVVKGKLTLPDEFLRTLGPRFAIGQNPAFNYADLSGNTVIYRVTSV
ncbi:hypothetical protein [Enterobacter mori]|uniref:hypothetical protein n=1 Tax=Enterobacter mori TaxID=539813 RepID=UPI003B83A949